MPGKKIAVIADDDKDTLRTLVDTLEEDGFEVALALDTNHALQLIRKNKPALVVSEICQPNYDGLLLYEAYKKESGLTENLKMVILTNNEDEKNEILSFDLGIEDFLYKPLRRNAFRKRVSRYFKVETPTAQSPKKQFIIRDLLFDVEHKKIYRLPQKQLIPMQSRTFDILILLALNSQNIFSREALIEAVSKSKAPATSRSIDVHILKIRQLLGESYIKTIKGVGYMFMKKNDD